MGIGNYRPALSLLSVPGGGTTTGLTVEGEATDDVIGCLRVHGLKRASGRASGRMGVMAEGSERIRVHTR